ncbi:PPR10, partial [Symbiodinium sp. CCMP2456]
ARSYSSSITATQTWTRALHLGAPRLASESVVCRNGVVAAATRAGVWARAAALLAALCNEVEPNIVSFGGAVGPWPHAAALAVAATSVGLRPTVVLYNSIANACGEDGRWSAALLALQDMIQVSTTPTIVTYNCLIRASAQQGLWQHSLEILQARLRVAPHTDMISFNSAIAALSEIYDWPRALDLLQRMQKRKLLPDTVTYNSVLNICAQAGEWMAAVAVFDRLTLADVQPNEISYSSLLSACDKGSRWQLALSVLRALRLGEVLPGIMSFNSAVNACGRGGLEMHAVGSLWVRQLRFTRPAESERWWGTTLPLQQLRHTLPRGLGNTHEKLELQATSAGELEKLAVHPRDKVDEVGRKNMQLRIVLKSTPWPKLMCFEAKGHVYDLPLPVLRQASASSDKVEDATVRFLAGFFDGDGCVSCQMCLSGCRLAIDQSFDRAEILMLFRKSLGGSITSNKDGLGLCKPVLRWQVCGELARRAARLMAPHSITKQKQLLLAAEWPEAQSCREKCYSELRSLKTYDSAVAGTCSWEYVAGFFDAEGWIGQPRGGVSIVLVITQKHPSVLECLRSFLERSANTPIPKVRSGPHAHVLRICGLLVCKQVLHEMLKAGLLGKAKQASVATSLTEQNAASRSAELADLTGNQRFGNRLDTAGRERAREIQKARARAARCSRRGQEQQAEAQLNEIEVLQHEHELLNARLENQRLLDYVYNIRKARVAAQRGSK